MLTLEEVKKIADLAMIELKPNELEIYREQLGSIIEYVEQLKELEESETNKSSPVDLKNVMSKDVPRKSLSQKDALANRKHNTKKGYFVITSVQKDD